jgi:hypothetical protein
MTSTGKKTILVAAACLAVGLAGVGCVAGGYNVAVQPVHGSQMLVRSALNEQMCWDAQNGKAEAGTPVVLWPCGAKENQHWTFADQAGGMTSVLGIGGLCLGARGLPAADGAPLELAQCNGQPNEQFRHNADGRLVEVGSGKCLTARSPAQTTPVTLAACDVSNGGQVWTIAK